MEAAATEVPSQYSRELAVVGVRRPRSRTALVVYRSSSRLAAAVPEEATHSATVIKMLALRDRPVDVPQGVLALCVELRYRAVGGRNLLVEVLEVPVQQRARSFRAESERLRTPEAEVAVCTVEEVDHPVAHPPDRVVVVHPIRQNSASRVRTTGINLAV
jgi:hypothetical protein